MLTNTPCMFTQNNEDGTKEVVIFDFEPFNVLVVCEDKMRMFCAEYHHKSTSYSFGETLPSDAQVEVVR